MDEPARAWVARALEVDRVREVRSLSFGIISDLRLLEANGRLVVLRRYRDAAVLARLPRLVSDEACALVAARAVLGRFVPELLGTDPSGSEAGHPALLMAYLPGTARIHGLDPTSLATPLVALHRRGDPSALAPSRHWFDSARRVPRWTRAPAAWERLLQLVAGPEPDGDPVFLHRDYHPGNLLWRGSELVGIVDWAFGCRGPRGIDIAHTRANLALVDGVGAADRFLIAYQSSVPGYHHHPWWDAAALAGFDDDFTGVLAFRSFGAQLDVELLRSRADAYATGLARGL